MAATIGEVEVRFDYSLDIRLGTRDRVWVAIVATSEAIKGHAARLVHRVTPGTRSLANPGSWAYETHRDDAYTEVGARRRFFYQKYVERGTSHAHAAPHLQPAADAESRDHEARMRDAIIKGTKR